MDKLGTNVTFDFVSMGFVATPELGRVYVDVGNAFCSGVLDHHHPDAPDACTAMLVLNHPEYVMNQIMDGGVTIIPHQYPDMDAVTGAYFARMHALGKLIEQVHHDWAAYACRVDQGFTTLTPAQPITPYSLFMMRMHVLREALPDDADAASRIMLDAGFDFLDVIFDHLRHGGSLHEVQIWGNVNTFTAEIAAIKDDLKRYQKDIKQADIFTCHLPTIDGSGSKSVAGLWIEKPAASMFKSWARGDEKHAGDEQGFVFLGIQVSDHRFILSVNPSSNLYLKGLGDLIEQAETDKRKMMGMERQGENRPGYDSPDPWYDGRSPLHNYTIIDSPRSGTVLREPEVAQAFHSWLAATEKR